MSAQYKNDSEERLFSPQLGVEESLQALNSYTLNWSLVVEGNRFSWGSSIQRIKIIREGLPYAALEAVSRKGNLAITKILSLFQLPQTTYNKRKREQKMMSSRDSEAVLHLSELFDFGKDVFNNNSEKFFHWLNKSNVMLNGETPIDFCDSISGINEVRGALERIEYGNLA